MHFVFVKTQFLDFFLILFNLNDYRQQLLSIPAVRLIFEQYTFFAKYEYTITE